MSRKIRLAAIVLLCWAGAAGAAAEPTGSFDGAGTAFAPAFGPALPPVGFVEYCARDADECRTTGAGTHKAQLTAQRWRLLGEVNSYVNRKITPAHDLALHGVAEYWTIPTEAGDCEDYVLLKKRYLEGLGFPAETLLITVVLDEHGGGHAVLMVRTTAGDFVLDNRRDDLKRWPETGYNLLKRQSQSDPLQWVALTPQSTREPGAIAGGN